MKITTIAAVFSAFLLLFGGCNQKRDIAPMEKNALLIDVRSAEEFGSGHIKGAINIPHTQIAEKISGVAADKSTPLYLYCRSGRRVGIAIKSLQKLGYKVMFNLGGYEEAQKFMEKKAK